MATSSKTKMCKTEKSTDKIMATVFWNVHGSILVDLLQKEESVGSEAHTENLKRLRARIHRSRKKLKYESAKLHSIPRTMEAITTFRWTTLWLHLPYLI